MPWVARFRQAVPPWLVPALAVALPLVAAILSLWGQDWRPSGDHALQVLRVRDVGGEHTPLVGAWSRWGWAHPGPLLFWLLAPFEHGLADLGVLVGTGLLNLVAAVAAVALAHRRGGWPLSAASALTMSLLVRGLGVEFFIDPWNPQVALLPFLLMLLLVWAVVCGDLVMLPAAVAAGSFAIQSHVGYLVPVGALLALALGAAGMRVVSRRRDVGPAAKSLDAVSAQRWLVVSLAVGALLWAPPLVEQFRGDGGNLSRIVTFVTVGGGEERVGWDLALEMFGAHLTPPGVWATGDRGDYLFGWPEGPLLPAVGVVVAAAALAVRAWRRGDRDAAKLVMITLLSLGLGLVATARVEGMPSPYIVRWWWAMAAAFWLGLLWVTMSALPTGGRRGVAAMALLGAVAVGSTGLARLPAPVPLEEVSSGLSAIVDDVARRLDPDDRVLVRAVSTRTWGAVESGLVLALSRRGFEVFVEPDITAGLRYGAWRVARADQVDQVVTVVEMDDLALGWEVPRGSRLLAKWDPLSPRERENAVGLHAELRAAMGERAPKGMLLLESQYAIDKAVEAGASPAAIAAYNALQSKGVGFAVFVTPACANRACR